MTTNSVSKGEAPGWTQNVELVFGQAVDLAGTLEQTARILESSRSGVVRRANRVDLFALQSERGRAGDAPDEALEFLQELDAPEMKIGGENRNHHQDRDTAIAAVTFARSERRGSSMRDPVIAKNQAAGRFSRANRRARAIQTSSSRNFATRRT